MIGMIEDDNQELAGCGVIVLALCDVRHFCCSLQMECCDEAVTTRD